MKVKVEALTAFSHYALLAAPGAGPLDGGLYRMAKGEAQELEKNGFVRIVEDEPAPQTGVTDSQDTDDLLGDTKAEPAPQNKMQPAPDNKGAAPKPKK